MITKEEREKYSNWLGFTEWESGEEPPWVKDRRHDIRPTWSDVITDAGITGRMLREAVEYYDKLNSGKSSFLTPTRKEMVLKALGMIDDKLIELSVCDWMITRWGMAFLLARRWLICMAEKEALGLPDHYYW